jgi:hypothetical protein
LFACGLARPALAAIDFDVTGDSRRTAAYVIASDGTVNMVAADPAAGDFSVFVAPGSSASTLTYDVTTGATEAVFRFETSQTLGAGMGSSAGDFQLNFILHEPVNFELSGSFAGSGAGSLEKYYLDVSLGGFPLGIFRETERTGPLGAAALHLNNSQDSTSPEVFVNSFQQLAGSLAPGSYSLFGSSGLADNGQFVGSTTASGFVQLRLFEGAPAAVPEPSTLVMFGLSCAGLAYYRRQRKRDALRAC